ncbi:hypothetical protein [Sphingopyxis granuli]|uniref:Uncharacterized protein n=2 Tax=Rhizorhabdus wittichii TaxID=160791 RepID=A0A975HGQ6_9SPHN|nr:hypothetical protein [Sphingopyxis granuli]QTH24720.1 hypothetical protein HRJ34_27945 [Rhizorhabdus wittichii]
MMMAGGNKPPDEARIWLLVQIHDLLSAYLLDHCPEEQSWEDFDADIDALRTDVANLRAQHLTQVASQNAAKPSHPGNRV